MTENEATRHMITATENRAGSVGRSINGAGQKLDPETKEVPTRSPYTKLATTKAPIRPCAT